MKYFPTNAAELISISVNSAIKVYLKRVMTT